MRRIVLYHPRLSDTRRNPPPGKDLLPLSVLTIAAWPVRDGYDVVVIDGNLFDDAEAAHRHVLEACRGALILGTTGIAGFQVADGFKCTERVRADNPQITTIVGGWFASVAPETCLASGAYDAVCLGQGEVTFREFVAAVDSGVSLDTVAGLALADENGIRYTDHRRVVGWNDLLNCPWELIDFEPYREAQLNERGGRLVERLPRPSGLKAQRHHVGISYFSSFGCPEPCTFCCSPEVTGQRWKAMPAERMLDDLQELNERWDFDVIRFLDANWGVAEKRTRAFCEGVLDRDLKFYFYPLMQAFSLLRYDEHTIDAMAESGCYQLNIGAETGSAETMSQIGKHTRPDDNYAAAVKIDDRGMIAWMTYVIGYPDESPESMYATLDEARRIRAECRNSHPSVWPYQPLPGTPMYRRAIELGFQPPEGLMGWGEFGEYHLSETWPGNVPPDVLRRRKLYQHFATLSHGLARGKEGWWERRARKRLASGDWRLARLEAKAFDLCDRFTRKVAGDPKRAPAWLQGDGVASTAGKAS